MRDSLPSITAMAVASARAIATLPGAHAGGELDPIATSLLPRPLEAALQSLARIARTRPWISGASRALSLGLVDHLALRTMAIDRSVAHAIAAGVDQLVILGAGLDARAHRMDALRGVTVFEIDHPSTQGYKVERAASAEVRAARVEYVPVHFERESVAAGLARSSHDRSRPTVFIWEGVTMYLPLIAVEQTLADVVQLSAPGSTLLTTYVTPDKVTARGFVAPIADVVFRALGEPLRGVFTPEEWTARVRRAGLDPIADTSPTDWVSDFGYQRRSLLVIAERLSESVRA